MTGMEPFWQLVEARLAELTGAEFKIIVYVYRRCRKRRGREVEISIAELAAATGLSWRQTQSVLQRLARKGFLSVSGGKGRKSRCSWPSVLPARPAAGRQPAVREAASSPAVGGATSPDDGSGEAGSREAGPDLTPERASTAPEGPGLPRAVAVPPIAPPATVVGARIPLAADADREVICLVTKLFRAPDRAFLRRLEEVAAGRGRLLQGLRAMEQRQMNFDPSNPALFLSAVDYQCR